MCSLAIEFEVFLKSNVKLIKVMENCFITGDIHFVAGIRMHHHNFSATSKLGNPNASSLHKLYICMCNMQSTSGRVPVL